MKYILKWVVVLFCGIVFITCSSVEKFIVDDDLYRGVAAIVEPDDAAVVVPDGAAIVELDDAAVVMPDIVFISSAIGGNFPIFSSQYAEDWEKILPPQEVVVINKYDNWLEVYLDDEIWWVDTSFVPSLDEIEEAFSSLGDKISFYFYNIETGFQHGFRSNKAYAGASVGKVFYDYFLYTQDEIGSITLTEQERSWIKTTLRRSLDEFSLNLNRRYGVVKYNKWLEKARNKFFTNSSASLWSYN